MQRYSKGERDTLGIMYVIRDGVWDDVGHTLEDPVRDVKVKKDTCIPGPVRLPAGHRYVVVPRKVGGKIADYKKEFGADHHSMLWIHQLDEKGKVVTDAKGTPVIRSAAGDEWTYCYIHRGNHEGHTEGCPLIAFGSTTRKDADGRRALTDSNRCYDAFRKMVYAAWDAGETVALVVWESDTSPPVARASV